MVSLAGTSVESVCNDWRLVESTLLMEYGLLHDFLGIFFQRGIENIIFAWIGACQIRLNPQKVRLNIEMNIPGERGEECGPDTGESWGPEWRGAGISHPTIWYPIPLMSHQSGIIHSLIFYNIQGYAINFVTQFVSP